MDVYVDLLFLVNLLLNGWALWLSSTLVGQKLSWQHLLLSSSLGAFYGLGIVTPWASWFSHPVGKILLALLMVQIAFRPRLMLRLVQLTGLFLFASFITAGCVLGLQTLLGGGLPGGTLAYGKLPLWVVLAAACGMGLGSHRVLSLLENRLVHVANRATVSFLLEGQELSLNGLVDSGNQLTDPLSRKPVIVVPLHVVSHALPKEVLALATSEHPLSSSLQGLSGQPWAARIRFIPYHSVGLKSGILVGWRLDWAAVATDFGSKTTDNVIMAVAGHGLGEQSAYDALIPERLLPAVSKQTQEVFR